MERTRDAAIGRDQVNGTTPHIRPRRGGSSAGHRPAEMVELRGLLRELVGAVGEYGDHLRSHTTILESMSEASQELASVVGDLRREIVRADGAPRSNLRGVSSV